MDLSPSGVCYAVDMPVAQPRDESKSKDEKYVPEVPEKGLCGGVFEPLLAENALQSGAPYSGTQTLVCKHSFHLKRASESAL